MSGMEKEKNMDQYRLIDAFNRVVDQLNNGYLDISDGMMDKDEMDLVRNAIEEYRLNHLNGVTLTLLD